MGASERESYILYIMGVSTPMPSEKKPYLLFVTGVGLPI